MINQNEAKSYLFDLSIIARNNTLKILGRCNTLPSSFPDLNIEAYQQQDNSVDIYFKGAPTMSSTIRILTTTEMCYESSIDTNPPGQLIASLKNSFLTGDVV